ncbi:MAG: HAD family hydrolase [Chitinophagaceae bacterium]
MASQIPPPKITALFIDIGGVLLTNGWDRHSREAAATKFDLDLKEMQDRHHLCYDTYESGKLPLEDYLNQVVFYCPRKFTPEQFRAFMYTQSQPYPQMLQLISKLKIKYGLKIVVVSNEGRELTTYRIKTFQLNSFVDFFISSCFVHFRKPDADIFKIALDVSQVPVENVLYLEDRLMFIQVAQRLGIQGIQHLDFASTCRQLSSFGLIADGL